MSFCGYKYKFGLYAAHSNFINSDKDTHFHNFSIVLYIDTLHHQIDDNFYVEKVITDWLQQFQGQQLTNLTLFFKRETTVEGIGNTFFDPLYDLIDTLGFELVRLDIFENPIRVFSVSKKLLDNTVNEINHLPVRCVPIIQLGDRSKQEVSNAEKVKHIDEDSEQDSEQDIEQNLEENLEQDEALQEVAATTEEIKY